ncbi:MAG TPA: hypothetical protein VEG66_02965 [Thermoplasmata archaeon]|jgi:hypothetical protein|nr:hypothetical protein [Thermoplasmata archaeon]
MRRGNLRRNRNGGALLDLVVGMAFVLLGAFALASVGITFPEILRGASRFFGLG